MPGLRAMTRAVWCLGLVVTVVSCGPPTMTADECNDPDDSCRLVIFPGDECPIGTEVVGYIPEGSHYRRPSVCCSPTMEGGCVLP